MVRTAELLADLTLLRTIVCSTLHTLPSHNTNKSQPSTTALYLLNACPSAVVHPNTNHNLNSKDISTKPDPDFDRAMNFLSLRESTTTAGSGQDGLSDKRKTVSRIKARIYGIPVDDAEDKESNNTVSGASGNGDSGNIKGVMSGSWG
jgi:hypothetical protein